MQPTAAFGTLHPSEEGRREDPRTWGHRSDPRGRLRIRRRERALVSRCPEGRVGTAAPGLPFGARRPARAGRGGTPAAPGRVPDDVVAVAPVELLPVLAWAVHHADARYEVHDLRGHRVVEVVAALMAPVALHPLEPQVAAPGSPGRHVGAPSQPRHSARVLTDTKQR